MTGPTPTISKKRNTSKKKTNLPVLNSSPVSRSSQQLLASTPETLKNQEISGKSRRRLDLSKIDVRAGVRAAESATNVTTVGALTSRARKHLVNESTSSASHRTHKRSEFEVTIDVIPIRVTEFTKQFGFVLFADHTGYVSILGKTSVFSEITNSTIDNDDSEHGNTSPQSVAFQDMFSTAMCTKAPLFC